MRASLFGYPKEIRLTPASDTKYSWSQRSKTGPYARAAGNYHALWWCEKLCGGPMDRFVIFSSGEGVKLDFDPSGLKPLPELGARLLLFRGWIEKDMDFYAADAFTVEPLRNTE